jgi:sec-independent protein translocase protein TatB
MFDIGFSELIVIGLVALIVIGPERLPRVARTAGHLLGRLQRYVNDVKADINREMQLDELKRLQQQVEDSAREMELTMHKEVAAVEESLNAPVKALEAEAAQLSAVDASSGGVEAAATAPAAEPAAIPQLELDLGRQAASRNAG